MANNNVLFNAALAGFMGGLQQRALTSAVAASYAGDVAAAVAFATRVDSKIPTDVTISAAGGAVSAAPANASLIPSKMELLKSICMAVITGRWTADAVAADYDVLATAVAACYTQSLASSLIP